MAICNHANRSTLLSSIAGEDSVWKGDKDRVFNTTEISWLSMRNMKVRQLKCNGVSVDIAEKIAALGMYLHALVISDRSITDGTLIRIIEGYPYLGRIDVNKCPEISDISLSKIEEVSPGLKSLNVSGLTTITDTVIIQISEACPDMEYPNLSNCYLLTDAAVIKIAESFPNLKALYLQSCRNVSDYSSKIQPFLQQNFGHQVGKDLKGLSFVRRFELM